ncbi:MAG: biotin--[acetyl-CoA-carboxylase] ligase [Acidobacteriaceae bacterium]
MIDMLDLGAIHASLSGTIFAGKVHLFPTIDSTNAFAMREGASGALHGSVYVAEEQTAGRGRGDHAWHSEPHAGLYLSILLRPRITPSGALWLTLLAGLAVQEAIANVTNVVADIRWPNDLLFGSRKFGGILTEMSADAVQVRYAVIGIGINVSHGQFPPDLRGMATSLFLESVRAPARQDVLIAILQVMDSDLGVLLSDEGFEAATESILKRMEKNSSWVRGKWVMVGEAGGYTGVTAGLDTRGFLRVETSGGIRTVLSGGVRAASAKD